MDIYLNDNFQSVEVREELTVPSSQSKDGDLCCSVQRCRHSILKLFLRPKIHGPVSTHIWDPTGGNMGKIMGPLWATQRGPTWGMIMGFHWDPSGISLGTHMGPRSFPSKSHTNSHMGPNWVCPCISHIYIFIYICIIYKFILLMLFLFIVWCFVFSMHILI